MLPDSWETANAQVGNWEVFEQISLSLWSELAEPGSREDGDNEARLFWNYLTSMNPSFAEQILLFLEQKCFDVENRSRVRDRYRRACNAIFRDQYEKELIGPLTEELRIPEFIKDPSVGSRYRSLFQDHGIANVDVRRQSYLEYIVRISPRRMRTALNNVRTRLVALNEDGMLRDFQEWIDSFDALHEHETLQMPQGFFSSVWNVYKATMQDPSYFSVYMSFCYLHVLPE